MGYVYINHSKSPYRIHLSIGRLTEYTVCLKFSVYFRPHTTWALECDILRLALSSTRFTSLYYGLLRWNGPSNGQVLRRQAMRKTRAVPPNRKNTYRDSAATDLRSRLSSFDYARPPDIIYSNVYTNWRINDAWKVLKILSKCFFLFTHR